MFTGMVAPIITPINEDETIDLDGLATVIERVLQGGAKGVFVGGTVGEGIALRDKQKSVLYRNSVDIVGKRAVVLGNVCETSTYRALELLELAIEAGMDTVVVTARLGFPRRTDNEVFNHVSFLAEKSTVPVWYYEIPPLTGVTCSMEQMRAICGLASVQGVKYSGSSRDFFGKCVHDLQPEVPVLTGVVEDIIYGGTIGAAGIVPGFASLAPRACVDAFESAKNNDIKTAQLHLEGILSLYKIYGEGGWPYWPTAQKYALEKIGVLKNSYSTRPFNQLTADDKRTIDTAMEKIDLRVLDV